MKRRTTKASRPAKVVSNGELRWQRVVPKADAAVLSGRLDRKGSEFVVRYRLQKGFQVPPHWHPGDEHITMISGRFRLGTGKKTNWKKAALLRAGDYVYLPARQVHYTRCEEETIVQAQGVAPFRIIYVNPDEDPMKKAKIRS
jgi:quercetin dioxygenase-like cupin family protein